MKKYILVGFENVDITDGFWHGRQVLNREVTIPAVRDRFTDTHRFEAFRFGWTPEKDWKPHFFWDSDIAKWIESVSYSIRKVPDPELEAKVDEVVGLIEKHQEDDGYFNIYFTVVEPGKRFTDRSLHELYCAGHLTEAAVAYYQATGKDKFLNCMRKYLALIDRKFRQEHSAGFATPGHEELELALVKLWRCTGERRWLELSKYFIDTRGTPDDVYDDTVRDYYNQTYNRTGMQAHLPVREQYTAEGHAVRACYLYSGMADNVYEFDDERLMENCRAIFDNIAGRRMYITGGVGSTRHSEAFTKDYDLPNAGAYAESCAAIALAFFARRMSLLDADSKYADTVERILYNGFLSSTSLDGKKFFYENPLSITLSDRGRNTSMLRDPEPHPITQRVEVFSCSCCPPNITRFVASLGDYLYSHDDETVFVHQYMTSKAVFEVGGVPVTVEQETDYPAGGRIKIKVTGMAGKKIALRIPGWAAGCSVGAPHKMRKGYAYIDCAGEDEITLELDMTPAYIEADPAVTEDAGRVAVMRGPMVFCAEAIDNGGLLDEIMLSPYMNAEVGTDPELGVMTLTVDGFRRSVQTGLSLYRRFDGETEPVKVRLIPYYAFANRGESEMRVFLRI